MTVRELKVLLEDVSDEAEVMISINTFSNDIGMMSDFESTVESSWEGYLIGDRKFRTATTQSDPRRAFCLKSKRSFHIS